MSQNQSRIKILIFGILTFVTLSFSFQNCGNSRFVTKDFVANPDQLNSASETGGDPNPPLGQQPSPVVNPNPNPNPTPVPVPVPGPAVVTRLAPNLPAGLKQILHHDFTTREGNGCNAYYPGGSLLMNDPNEPSSPSGFIRNIKYAGASEGGTMVDCVHPVKGEVYYAFTWRPSSPFGGYDNGSNKMVFYISSIPNSSGGAWGSHYYGKTNGQRVVNFFLQGGGVNNCHVENTYGDCAESTSMVFLPNVDKSPVLEGKWHRIEVYFKRSTTSSSKDGIAKMWVDGSLRISHNNVNTPQYDWTSIMTNHTWDGQCAKRNSSLPSTTLPNDCRPYDDYHDFGDFFVGAK